MKKRHNTVWRLGEERRREEGTENNDAELVNGERGEERRGEHNV